MNPDFVTHTQVYKLYTFYFFVGMLGIYEIKTVFLQYYYKNM